MCGIVGYVGFQVCAPLLFDGLKRLEYRGYDSSGMAIMQAGQTLIVRSAGKLANLSSRLEELRPDGTLGIGHTRWATHGRPSEQNAHPHKAGRVSLVHNGIIENHAQLRELLLGRGHVFSSETDTEIVAHLVDEELRSDVAPIEAVRAALRQVQGAYAICVLFDGEEDLLIAARQDAPLILGLGQGENFVASDIPAILSQTRDMVFLQNGDLVELHRDRIDISSLEGARIERPVQRVLWDAVVAEKGGYKHFMQKEIDEQPRAVVDTIGDRLSVARGDAFIDGFEFNPTEIDRVVMVACGTSYHAALVGKFLIEGLARLPVEVDLGSEFRYRDPIVGPRDLVVPISQSGETADTLAALRTGREKGAKVLSICNVVGSSISRESDGVLYTHAGPEIGVASTKAFTTQLAAMVVLALHIGRRTGALSEDAAKALIADLVAMPEQMKEVLGHGASINVIARRYSGYKDFLFLGRGINYPIALEGALKLKEISYIHAEGYPAGEMKHGPIALIDENMPVVVIAPRGSGYEKIISNLAEVRARRGRVIAVASRDDHEIGELVDEIIQIPHVRPELQPLLTVLPLQMLAYRVADIRGTDVDQPRNLAKSVTVE